MSKDREIVKAYSKDRHIYHHETLSIRRKSGTSENSITTSTSRQIHIPQLNRNRNRNEYLSLSFAASNARLQDLEKQTIESIRKSHHEFDTINYPLSPQPMKIQVQISNTKQQTKILPNVKPAVCIRNLLLY